MNVINTEELMELEQQIKEAGADVAPRVTPAQIQSKIIECHYINAGEAARIPWPDSTASDSIHENLNLLTICVLVLENGFTVTGESACASSENFNAEIGRIIARDNAVEKVWLLEGYLLKQNLHETEQSKSMLKGFLEDDNCEGGGCKL